MSILTKNGHSWYPGSIDSESRLRFLNFQPQNPFLGKFGPKKSKLFVLLENWHLLSYSNLVFRIKTLTPTLNSFSGKFGPKKSKYMVSWGCWFLFQNWSSEFQNLNPFFGKRPNTFLKAYQNPYVKPNQEFMQQRRQEQLLTSNTTCSKGYSWCFITYSVLRGKKQ